MKEFIKGMGTGLIAGAAVGTFLAAGKKGRHIKGHAGKTIKSFGELVDNLSCAFGRLR